MKRKHQWMMVVPVMAAVMALILAVAAGVGYAEDQDPAAPADQGFPGGPHMGRGLARHTIGGEVVKVEDNTVTVKLVLTGDEIAVKVDDQTKYRKDGNDATLADVQPGVKAAFIIREIPADGEDPLANAVIIGEPGEPGQHMRDGRQGVVGTVSAINGDTVTIQTADGEKQVKLPAVTQGMRIGVVVDADGTVHGVMYNPPEIGQGAQGTSTTGGNTATPSTTTSGTQSAT